MLILSLDSSAKAASVALMEDSKLLGEFFVDTAFTHSRTLAPMIENLLSVTGKTTDDIDLIAVSNGPGSFTGIRIGVAVAKGIAFVRDIPAMAISTLESMAYNLAFSDCVVCAVMDARRSQVYNAIFRVEMGKVHRLCDDRALSIADLKAEISKKYGKDRVVIVGDGAHITFQELADSDRPVELAPVNLIMQRASSVALATLNKFNEGEAPIKASELIPSYLRLSQAERERKEKEQSIKEN